MHENLIYEKWIENALQRLAAQPSKDNLMYLAECYLDAASYYAMAKEWKACYDCIKCAELISIRSEAIVKKIITMCIRCKNTIGSSEIVNALFDLVLNTDFEGNAELRKDVFGAFHWFSKFWDAYLDFCDWWGFENFDITDFQIVDKRDSLAESAFIAYSRRLSSLTVAEYMFDFYVEFIDKMLAHNFTVYAEYHVCKFMIRTGFDVEEVLRGYRKYIKQKNLKPWSWTTLSHLFDMESSEYKACMLFAQECEGLKSESITMDYRAVCHDLFAEIKDADLIFWRKVQAKMREMRNSGIWTEKKKNKRG